jgi:hypothetical protein
MERDHQGHQEPGVMLSRLSKWLRRVTAGGTPAASPSSPSAPALAPPEHWPDQLALANLTRESWLEGRRSAGRLYADLSDDDLTSLAARCSAQAEQTRASADRVLRHEFDLLGSGWRAVVDPTRPPRGNGYRPIDWAVDPIAGLRFPTGFTYSDWNPQMRPGLADIKWPWEIGRCQHWITLGQAYRLTSDERYAAEIVDQHADFMETNPVGIGVQYVCTMDIAIRAFNWAIAFELIRKSAAFDAKVMARAYESLFDVGVFIERNLENKYEVTSNHFLSNVVGLYGLGVVFADLPVGRRWLRECREWLEGEMVVQILPDGADYESSVPYHRLVLELFLSGARLAEREGTPLSDGYRASLERMSAFMADVLRPDGLLPQVGDADDGRLHVFTEYGVWKPQDARHILAPAAMMFDRPGWLAASGDGGLWEAGWWGYDVTATRSAPAAREPVARLFEHAGIAVVKDGGSYLIVTNGRVGTNGFGNHKHNDLLSFEFHADGVPLVVDPGSYVYTSNPEARNLFRGTGYHNTIQIDGTEQNEIRPDYLFRLFETSTVEHLSFEDTADHVEYRGRHTGYTRLSAPVVHERTLRLLKNRGTLLIADRLRGSGAHTLRWHFHVAPGVEAERLETGDLALSTVNGRWLVRVDPALAVEVADAWYSPSYGVRVPCRALDMSVSIDVSTEPAFVFAIGPEAWIDSPALGDARAAFVRGSSPLNTGSPVHTDA